MRREPKGKRGSCVYCATDTGFQLERVGLRGAKLGYEFACIPCCEQPARRAKKLDAVSV